MANCSDSSLTTSSHVPSKAADLFNGGVGSKFAAVDSTVNKKPIGRGSKKRRVSDSLARCCHSCCAQGPQHARVVTSLCDGRQQHHRRCFTASESSSWNLRRSLPGVSYWNTVSPCAASVPATLCGAGFANTRHPDVDARAETDNGKLASGKARAAGGECRSAEGESRRGKK